MSSRNYYSFSNAARQRASRHGVDSIFAWTIFIFLLIGFALFCWMGSFYVFGHPEKAANYRLLRRLHKLEEPQRFQITAAPRGEFLKPEQLLERFGHLKRGERQRTNEALLRNFLRNYHQTRDLVPYAVGTYKVLEAFPLTEKNFFPSGMVALLQAVDQPEVLLEQTFTTNAKNLPALQQALSVNQEIKLEKPLDLFAIIFTESLSDGRIKLTTIPLLYGTYGIKQGAPDFSFSLVPPSDPNIEIGLPLLSAKEVSLADKNYAPYRSKGIPSKLEKNLSKGAVPSGPPKSPTLSCIIPDETDTSATNATASKKLSQSNTPPRATAVTGQTTVARALPFNVPPVLPATVVNPTSTTPLPLASVVKSPAITSLSNPALMNPAAGATETNATALSLNTLFSTPGITNTPIPAATPAVNVSGGIWPLYEPGKMPRGRLLDATQIPTLAEQGLAGERLYLQGNFSVTASGQDRAVLRYQSAINGLPIGRTGKIRIIAAYPAGTTPPAEGTSLLRDHQHPLMLTDVKKDSDGTINLYVREITR